MNNVQVTIVPMAYRPLPKSKPVPAIFDIHPFFEAVLAGHPILARITPVNIHSRKACKLAFMADGYPAPDPNAIPEGLSNEYILLNQKDGKRNLFYFSIGEGQGYLQLIDFLKTVIRALLNEYPCNTTVQLIHNRFLTQVQNYNLS